MSVRCYDSSFEDITGSSNGRTAAFEAVNLGSIPSPVALANMQKYIKVYTRENTFFCIEVWEDSQGKRLEKYFGQNVPLSIFDVHDGVASIYYHEKIFEIWQDIISKKGNSNPEVIENLMTLYASQIDQLEKIWNNGVFKTKEELVSFFDFMSEAWIGLSVSYCLPETKNISKKFQDLGMELRKRSVDFLDNTDRVILKTLKNLYPKLGDYVKYVSLEEIKSGNLPNTKVLEARNKHYIYSGFKMLMNIDANTVAHAHGIEIVEEKVPRGLKEIKGQIAMKGKVKGVVRVLKNKSQIKDMIDGEILVTAMTTPDYLPAMNKAVAFITDEGGITCHAAIVAREMGKPCIIGTKIATLALTDGDMVEVDAERGIVKIIE